jgi:hypothetical protein
MKLFIGAVMFILTVWVSIILIQAMVSSLIG